MFKAFIMGTDKVKDLYLALSVNREAHDIKKVIFNDPATIIIFSDGSKSVVKCREGEVYTKETGFAMAFLKHIFQDDAAYHSLLKTWLPEDPEVFH